MAQSSEFYTKRQGQIWGQYIELNVTLSRDNLGCLDGRVQGCIDDWVCRKGGRMYALMDMLVWHNNRCRREKVFRVV